MWDEWVIQNVIADYDDFFDDYLTIVSVEKKIVYRTIWSQVEKIKVKIYLQF